MQLERSYTVCGHPSAQRVCVADPHTGHGANQCRAAVKEAGPPPLLGMTLASRLPVDMSFNPEHDSRDECREIPQPCLIIQHSSKERSESLV